MPLLADPVHRFWQRFAGADSPSPQPGWQTDLGVGLIINPAHQGGEDYRASPVPCFVFSYVDQQGTK